MHKRLASLLLAFFLVLLGARSYATPAATPQQIQIGQQFVFGMQSVFPNTLFSYQEPYTTTCQLSGSTIISVPANTSNQAISIAALFPAFVNPVAIGIVEVTSPSQQVNIGLASGGARIHLAEGGFATFRVSTTNLPTFYVDNPSATDAALIQVFGLSN